MIKVLVPTRGRPQAAAQLLVEFEETVNRETTLLLFGVDLDDPQILEYRDLLPPRSYVLGPRRRLGPTLNWMAIQAAITGCEIVGFMGDDHRPRTSGWDETVHARLGQLNSEPGVAYGDDLIHGPNLPTAAFVSASLVSKMGWMVPPGLVHMYLDNFWLELGRATRLHYMADVVFEHLHPLVGKAAWTPQYEEANGWMGHDGAEYHRFMQEDWPSIRSWLQGSDDAVATVRPG